MQAVVSLAISSIITPSYEEAPMHRPILLTAFVLVASQLIAQAEELPKVKPESAGLAPGKLVELTPALQKLVDDGKIAGGVALVARHGKVAFTTSFGYRDLESKTPMTEDTIFRIASMTKPITCVALMMLIEQGKLGLDDPVQRYLPELTEMRVLGDSTSDKGDEITTVPARRPITVRHLLAHTSGFAYASRATDPRVKRSYAPVEALEESPGVWRESTTITDLVERLGKVALAHQPGEGWTYGMSHDVLGRLIEVVSNQRFDRYLEERIFRPLDMHDTAFLVLEVKRGRVATLYRADVDGKLSPLPRYYGSATFFSGGGGLFSTARDYARFAQMLLQNGTLGDARIVRPETIRAMTTNQVGDMATVIAGVPAISGMRYGLGFGLVPALGSGGARGVLGSYFWGGAFSTRFWVEPQHEVIALILTQVLPFNHGDAFGVFRQAVDAAIEN
jgi:CubicO group peptidase (beta-lactamase class C family)